MNEENEIQNPSELPSTSDSISIPSVPESKPYDPMMVKLPAYEGPFELLLDLIKKNDMDVYNIQISEITKQYLDHLQQMRELNLEVAGEFIVMAATLLYIKSKMLLPTDENNEDEDGQDPRTELVQKLLEYQAFRAAAKKLGFLEDERGKVFTRQIADYYLNNLSPEDVTIDSFSANLYDLLQAFQSVISQISRQDFHDIFEEVISIDDKMTEIKSVLSEKGSIKFLDLFKGQITKNLVIVTFLATLEIVRSKFARVIQEKTFGEISLERITTDALSIPSTESSS